LHYHSLTSACHYQELDGDIIPYADYVNLLPHYLTDIKTKGDNAMIEWCQLDCIKGERAGDKARFWYHKRTAEGQWEKPLAVQRKEDEVETMEAYLTRTFEDAIVAEAKEAWVIEYAKTKTRDVPAFDSGQVVDDSEGEMATKLFWLVLRGLPLNLGSSGINTIRPQLDVDFERTVLYEDMAGLLPPMLLKLFKRTDVDLTDSDEVDRMNQGMDLALIDDWCELQGPPVVEKVVVTEGAKEKKYRPPAKELPSTYWYNKLTAATKRMKPKACVRWDEYLLAQRAVPTFEAFVHEKYGFPKITEMGSVLFFLKFKKANLGLTDENLALVQRHFDADEPVIKLAPYFEDSAHFRKKCLPLFREALSEQFASYDDDWREITMKKHKPEKGSAAAIAVVREKAAEKARLALMASGGSGNTAGSNMTLSGSGGASRPGSAIGSRKDSAAVGAPAALGSRSRGGELAPANRSFWVNRRSFDRWWRKPPDVRGYLRKHLFGVWTEHGAMVEGSDSPGGADGIADGAGDAPPTGEGIVAVGGKVDGFANATAESGNGAADGTAGANTSNDDGAAEAAGGDTVAALGAAAAAAAPKHNMQDKKYLSSPMMKARLSPFVAPTMPDNALLPWAIVSDALSPAKSMLALSPKQLGQIAEMLKLARSGNGTHAPVNVNHLVETLPGILSDIFEHEEQICDYDWCEVPYFICDISDIAAIESATARAASIAEEDASSAAEMPALAAGHITEVDSDRPESAASAVSISSHASGSSEMVSAADGRPESASSSKTGAEDAGVAVGVPRRMSVDDLQRSGLVPRTFWYNKRHATGSWEAPPSLQDYLESEFELFLDDDNGKVSEAQFLALLQGLHLRLDSSASTAMLARFLTDTYVRWSDFSGHCEPFLKDLYGKLEEDTDRDWCELPTGREDVVTYWFNKRTCQSQWGPPVKPLDGLDPLPRLTTFLNREFTKFVVEEEVAAMARPPPHAEDFFWALVTGRLQLHLTPSQLMRLHSVVDTLFDEYTRAKEATLLESKEQLAEEQTEGGADSGEGELKEGEEGAVEGGGENGTIKEEEEEEEEEAEAEEEDEEEEKTKEEEEGKLEEDDDDDEKEDEGEGGDNDEEEDSDYSDYGSEYSDEDEIVLEGPVQDNTVELEGRVLGENGGINAEFADKWAHFVQAVPDLIAEVCMPEPDSACDWCELPNEPTLREVDLFQNGIGSSGACALADALRFNGTLETLMLQNNHGRQ
jgi:hypothetical protein